MLQGHRLGSRYASSTIAHSVFESDINICQLVYYPDDPIPQTDNIQITPFPGNLTKTQFVYDNNDHFFFASTTPTTSLYFNDDQLSLDHDPAPFFINENGLVSYLANDRVYDRPYKRDNQYTDFYAAPQRTFHHKRDHCQPESVIYEVAFH